MKQALIGSFILLVAFVTADADARREIRTPKQKEQLAQASRIWVNALALTDKGEVDSDPIAKLVSRRLEEVGYTTHTNRDESYDVEFSVKCEQRKVWKGTLASGGDADLPDSPMRTWRGPACQLTYYLKLRHLGWRKEVRADFEDSVKAAQEAKAGDPGAYALAQLMEKLERYDFPVLLAADWRHEDRLLVLLDAPNTSSARKVRIIRSLGQMFSGKAVPRLQVALKDSDPAIASASADALGDIGHQDSIKALADTLKTGSPELKIQAARGLGKLGALHGDFSVVPPLLDALETDDIELKTEVVWALGKLPDKRAYEPLYELQLSLQNIRTSDRDSADGRLWDAVNYSLKQIDPSDQIN